MNPEQTKQRFEQWTGCKLNNPGHKFNKSIKSGRPITVTVSDRIFQPALRRFTPQSRSISIGDMVKDNSSLWESVDHVGNTGQEDEK